MYLKAENLFLTKKHLSNSSPFSLMILDRKEILAKLESREIVITDFDPNLLGHATYDLKLGDFFSIQSVHSKHNPLKTDELVQNLKELQIYSPEDLKDIKKVGLDEVWEEPLSYANSQFLLSPGQLILGHSKEFFGIPNNLMMRISTKSNCARLGVSICKCSNIGNPGWFGRWTLEIENHSGLILGLHPGTPIGTISWEYTTAEFDKKTAFDTNSRQHEIENIIKNWQPKGILPYNSLLSIYQIKK